MRPYFAFLADLRAWDAPLFGGKAANLGELLHAKFDVPPGFVLSVDARQFDDLRRTEIGQLLSTYGDQSTFAVRSSGAVEDGSTMSWAGQFDSFLNVRREDVPRHIELCWASANSERALAYSKRAGVQPDAGGLGVIVQQFVPADVAGVCFTRHPVTQDDTLLVVEATIGLGQALVGGVVTPDTYVVRKTDGAIVESYVSKQRRAIVSAPSGGVHTLELKPSKRPSPKLSVERIEIMRDTFLSIERHFGRPQDIEFVVAGDRLAIVQSRPITA